MNTLSAAQTTIDAISEPTTSTRSVGPGSWKACLTPSRPDTPVIKVSETIVPIMNTSPWAKLISSMMP